LDRVYVDTTQDVEMLILRALDKAGLNLCALGFLEVIHVAVRAEKITLSNNFVTVSLSACQLGKLLTVVRECAGDARAFWVETHKLSREKVLA
jgi:hypothetical protein